MLERCSGPSGMTCYTVELTTESGQNEFQKAESADDFADAGEFSESSPWIDLWSRLFHLMFAEQICFPSFLLRPLSK